MHPKMRDGTPLRVKVTSMGDVGWWGVSQGFRYTRTHPNGKTWPPIPEYIRQATVHALRSSHLSRALREDPDLIGEAIDTCLINYYEPSSSLGWHVDQNEADRTLPIVTFSVGAAATFDIDLGGAVHSMTLESGDAIVMACESRSARHRIKSIMPPDMFSRPSPLPSGLRMSFTLRRARLLGEDQ